MRILWHSCAPWIPTGYGTQSAVWGRYLAGQGHDVAFSCYYGGDDPPAEWEGHRAYGSSLYGPAVTAAAEDWNADLTVMLADCWQADPHGLPSPLLAWMPADCTPLSAGDRAFLRRAGPLQRPLAMSAHGQEQIGRASGSRPPVIPHGIDTEVFRPDRDRAGLRAAFGIGPDTFAAGAVFTTIDAVRKATAELFFGFAAFHVEHPDSVLFCHAAAGGGSGLDPLAIAEQLGIAGAVRWADQDRVIAGYAGRGEPYTPAELARWYCAMDVVCNATCGEGFGMPSVEAQACGTPVIVSDNTTGPELAGPAGWVVKTDPMWNPVHRSWWGRPRPDVIKRRLEQAYAKMRSPFLRRACRQFACGYDYRTVGARWDELLEEIGESWL